MTDLSGLERSAKMIDFSFTLKVKTWIYVVILSGHFYFEIRIVCLCHHFLPQVNEVKTRSAHRTQTMFKLFRYKIKNTMKLDAASTLKLMLTVAWRMLVLFNKLLKPVKNIVYETR